jgi:hypothetical protein
MQKNRYWSFDEQNIETEYQVKFLYAYNYHSFFVIDVTDVCWLRLRNRTLNASCIISERM